MLEYLINNYYAACIAVIIAMIFAFAMSIRVKSVFNKYNKVKNAGNIPAYAVARLILDANGLSDVSVVSTPGNLTDHYDPSQNTVALSQSVYNNTSVSAIGVAAHECGHAIQHSVGYVPAKLRTALFPAVNIASRSWVLLFLIGMALSFGPLITAGIVFFIVVIIFQMITLPLEFDASHRALEIIKNKGILHPNELVGARHTLGAAAMTYVASLALSIAQLLRLLAMSKRSR